MTEKEKKPIISKETKAQAVKLLIIVVAAFATALLFRRSAGIIAMLPLAFIICGFTAFIGVDTKLKLIIYGITVFCVNTVEQKDINVTIMFTALCLLACAVFEIAARLIKKHKRSGNYVMAIGAVLCVCLSFVFVGNPITAISANKLIKDYTAAKYPQGENYALGEFEFSSIYYNHKTQAYEVEAISNKYPTEAGVISSNGATVSDSFKTIMKEKLAEPYMLEITAVLREYFPNDSFEIICDDIYEKPSENMLISESGKLNGSIDYEIYLGGVQTANAMEEKVEKYISVIDSNEIDYGRIIFKSGISPWVVRSVTVDGNRPLGFNDFTIQQVHPNTSNRFNRYVSRLIGIQ